MKDRVGEQKINNQGCLMTIIAYRGCYDIDVQFEDDRIIKNRHYSNFKKGNIKNSYYPSVYNIGYLGEGIYLSKINKKITKEYDAWTSMLRRCYSVKSFINHPSYKDCAVDERWHNFQVFAQWFEENYVEGFELDKDILIKGNKIYSPETCCLIPQEINVLFVGHNSARGKYPMGVSIKGSRFQTSLSKKGEKINLGTFDTPEKAFQAYKVAKEQYIKEIADLWKDQIIEKVYQALYNYRIKINLN